MNRVLLWLMIVFVAPAMLISDETSRISNGFNGDSAGIVPTGKYPFVVSVTFNDKHICGGFIYNSRFVVTSASCVYQKTSAQIQVTVGQLSLILPDPGELRFQVRTIIIHENYDDTTKFNDIAMIEVSQTIEFSENVNFTYYDSVDGSVPHAVISGWGAVDESKVVSTKLREARVYPPVDCDLFPADLYDPNIMFCWGDSVKDNGTRPCQGDEGSPLLKQTTTFFAMGIVSKNLGCGDSEIFETIYTRLSAYYGWMVRNGGPQP